MKMLRVRWGASVVQIRSRVFLLIICGVLLILFSYLYIEQFQRDQRNADRDIQGRILRLEQELQQNHLLVNHLRETVEGMLHGEISAGDKSLRSHNTSMASYRGSLTLPQCSAGNVINISVTDSNIYDIIENVPFTNEDGGVWKQGWELKYSDNQWSPERKLLVFIVPHSHNDPGWLKTFEKYFEDQTRKILDNVLAQLMANNKLRFIWAEVSFFSVWFDRLSPEAQQNVRNIVKQGQLEFVTGGWVMPDEANTHYFAIVEQLIEGHQWLKHNFNVTPSNGWAIDPFGLSPTMAYLLKRSGLEHMVIQRVHYFLKKHLGQQQRLEFHWRQFWDAENNTDMFCHTMPFYSYDIPHTCGPDPKICCQFDFRRLKPTKVNCPWRVPPVKITPENVEAKAAQLLDQYRKKSQLFQTNAVLVPLGDDFRYDTLKEWTDMISNYGRLIDYINARSDWNAHVQFATLKEYFGAVDTQFKSLGREVRVPSLAGDFFTYADKDDNYWSGYYTSRPFFKNVDRQVESALRSAEVSFSLMWSRMRNSGLEKPPHFVSKMAAALQQGRRHLGLFQHHDGITGTAKTHVVKDYGTKLLQALQELRWVTGFALSYLLLNPNLAASPKEENMTFKVDEFRDSFDTPMKKTAIKTPPCVRVIAVFNSLPHARSELVRVNVATKNLVVIDSDGNSIKAQLSPLFEGRTYKTDEFELSFIAHVGPFATTTYRIQCIEGVSGNVRPAMLTIVDETEPLPNTAHFPVYRTLHSEKKLIEIRSSYQILRFSTETGLLQQVKSLGTSAMNDTVVRISYVKFGTRPKGKERSGAYLFLPDQQNAIPITLFKPYMRVIQGELYSEVVTELELTTICVRLINSPGLDGVGFDIEHLTDLRKVKTNMEFAMMMQSNIQSDGKHFHVDLNGFQTVERFFQSALPIQANIYPMSAVAYIHDNVTRLSLLSNQPLGVTSANKPGSLMIFLDRKLFQDDNRGLQQAVVDNVVTPSQFRVLIEHFSNKPTGYMSLISQHALESFRHPLVVLIEENAQSSDELLSRADFMTHGTEFPCDIQAVTLRTLFDGTGRPTEEVAFILRRIAFDCTLPTPVASKCKTTSGGNLDISQVFPRDFKSEAIEETSLSLMHSVKTIPRRTPLFVPMHELKTVKLRVSA